MNRLYIVEGLPCSGKSSTARAIADMLSEMGNNVRYTDEGSGEHPADYEYHAFADGKVISLAQLSEEEARQLMPCKIYDGLPWEKEAPLMLEKWRQFVREADPDCIYVFNCVLLQNPMCETMMRFNMTEQESECHIRSIAGIIAPMRPIIIYMHNDDIRASVCRVSTERPGWLDAVISYHTDRGYGRAIGAHGFDGYIACLEERQRREERILQRLPVEKLVLSNPQRDWQTAHAQLRGLLAGRGQ